MSRLTEEERLRIIIAAVERADQIVLHKGEAKAALPRDMQELIVSALRLAAIMMLSKNDVVNNP